MEKVYQKWSTVLLLLILLVVPFSASAKIKLQMRTPASPDRVKQFDGSTFAYVRDENQGELDINLIDPAHPNITVYATAEYDNASLGSGKTITVTYHVDDVQTGGIPTSDSEFYEAPDPFTVNDGEITRYSSLTLSLSPEQFISKTKEYDGSDTAVFIREWPQLLNTVGTYTNIHITNIEAKYTNGNIFVGYNKTISITITIGGADAQYYEAPVVPNIMGASITQKPLTVTGVTVDDKTYDGTKTAIISDYGTLHGIVGSDEVYLSTEETTALYADKDAGENKQVSIHYVLGGVFRGQYRAPIDDNTKTSTISPLPLDVTGTTIDEKQYDGNTSANIDEEGTLNTVLAGDKVNLVVANARYASSDAGSHAVTADFSLSGRDAKNYTLRSTPQLNGVINPRQLTVTSPSIEDTKVYDGNNSCRIISAGTLGNVVSGEEGKITLNATAEYDNENVGYHKTVNITYTITEQNGKHNYIAPTLSQSKFADITAKQLYIENFEIDTTKEYDKSITAIVRNQGYLTGVVDSDYGTSTMNYDIY